MPANTADQDSRSLPALAGLSDVRPFERWAVVPLIALMLVLGFWPRPALDLVRPPAAVTLQQVGVQDVPAATATASEADK
jgi:NADH-quinone oxidoreductase subunit M